MCFLQQKAKSINRTKSHFLDRSCIVRNYGPDSYLIEKTIMTNVQELFLKSKILYPHLTVPTRNYTLKILLFFLSRTTEHDISKITNKVKYLSHPQNESWNNGRDRGEWKVFIQARANCHPVKQNDRWGSMRRVNIGSSLNHEWSERGVSWPACTLEDRKETKITRRKIKMFWLRGIKKKRLNNILKSLACP